MPRTKILFLHSLCRVLSGHALGFSLLILHSFVELFFYQDFVNALELVNNNVEHGFEFAALHVHGESNEIADLLSLGLTPRSLAASPVVEHATAALPEPPAELPWRATRLPGSVSRVGVTVCTRHTFNVDVARAAR